MSTLLRLIFYRLVSPAASSKCKNRCRITLCQFHFVIFLPIWMKTIMNMFPDSGADFPELLRRSDWHGRNAIVEHYHCVRVVASLTEWGREVGCSALGGARRRGLARAVATGGSALGTAAVLHLECADRRSTGENEADRPVFGGHVCDDATRRLNDAGPRTGRYGVFERRGRSPCHSGRHPAGGWPTLDRSAQTDHGAGGEW